MKQLTNDECKDRMWPTRSLVHLRGAGVTKGRASPEVQEDLFGRQAVHLDRANNHCVITTIKIIIIIIIIINECY